MTLFDLNAPGARKRAMRSLMLGDHGFLRVWFTNRHQITPKMARSNQPSPKRIAEEAARGTKTILNVRGDSPEGFYALEREACEEHGIALVYDCHSIRSEIPYLFEGRLPDFNIGTNEGRTCAPELQAAMEEVCRSASGYSTVVNGRFKGGWTTRQYGRPHQGVHAVQMELAQSAYLQSEAPPFAYDEVKAERLRPVLKSVLDTLLAHLRGLQPG